MPAAIFDKLAPPPALPDLPGGRLSLPPVSRYHHGAAGSRLYRQTPHCDPLGPVLPANALCRTLRRELQMSTITTGRLTTPLIRESHGHRPASWEEALDFVAGKLRRQIETHGPRSFGMFSC